MFTAISCGAQITANVFTYQYDLGVYGQGHIYSNPVYDFKYELLFYVLTEGVHIWHSDMTLESIVKAKYA